MEKIFKNRKSGELAYYKDFDVYKESPMFQNFKNLAKTKL